MTISFTLYRFIIIAAAVLAALTPLFVVLYQSFLTAPFLASTARLSLAAYRFVFADEDFAVAFGTTLLLSASMTLIAVPLGVMLAFLMVRTNVPARQWLEPVMLVPIFIPSVVLAFGYVAALGPAGMLTTWFEAWTGRPAWNLYSFSFLVAIAGLTHVPHAYLYTAGALRALGTELEEAARAAGAGAWKVALGVSLPMVLPAILSAGVLVFFFGFELFGLPLVLGDPQGLLVLSTYLFKLGGRLGVQANQFMAVAAVIVIAIALPLAFMQRALLREAQRHVPTRIRSARAAPHKLGRWRWPVLVIIALWLAATVLVPLAGITLRSVTGTWEKGTALLQALTFDHYRELLDHGDALRSIANTLAIGLLGGAAALACYAALALAVHRRPFHRRTFHRRTFHRRTWRWTQAVDYLVMAPRAMPGLVAGLALLWVLLLFKPLTPLRETLVSVWLAYAILWMAYGLRIVSGSLLQVNPELEDAARAVGAAEARVRRDITLPLIRNALLASWLLIFLVFVREYATGVYLLAPGTEVMGSLLVSLWENGMADLVAPLSVVNVAIIGAGLVIANRLGVRLHG